MTTTCKHCGAIKPLTGTAKTRAQLIKHLRFVNTHRRGKYADAYRLGLSVASGEIDPAIDAKALGIGYRDGLSMRNYRVPTKGKGAKARNGEAVKRHRSKLLVANGFGAR